MRLSVVTTLYHSAPYLREFYARMLAAIRTLTDAYEIILVNDGSPDEALQVALELRAADSRITIVDLSRNFGHHQAIMTGLRYARGDQVFLIDCDLEEDPALLLRFDQVRRDRGADVVFGVQDVRRGTLWDRFSGYLYYKFLNSMTRYPLPENLLTVRLMSQRYVTALLQHPEVELNIAGLWVRTGFQQESVPVEKKRKGSSTYTFARKIGILVNGVTSLSSQPLVFIFYLGCLIILLASSAALYVIARQLVFGDMQSGWPSLIVSVWLIGGLMIFCQGLIGIYLSKVVLETKRRPISIVRQVYSDSVARTETAPSKEEGAVRYSASSPNGASADGGE
jgi:putative glycosyltransferase